MKSLSFNVRKKALKYIECVPSYSSEIFKCEQTNKEKFGSNEDMISETNDTLDSQSS